MTNDIPERLRKLAKDIAFGCVPATWRVPSMERTICINHAWDAIATALHEIEQAARAEGERAGIERAAKWHEEAAEKMRAETKPDHLVMRCGVVGHLADAAALRALPTTAEPAKGA